MRYIAVEWLWYRFPDRYEINDSLPIKIYSEINEQGEEVRKIEFFLNGKVGLASSEVSYCEVDETETELSDQVMPESDVMNEDGGTDFVIEITKEYFEQIWQVVVDTIK
ncbi:hypothetical protein M3201_21535 [Paenibacillus motobuensis]|uniref:DUF6881 domain-containing protein n=1 Tax=Paenibacillus TaxID=44249 RepID=UPI00203A68A9|nr:MULTISPECIES: hypothetical protein [Paenibacillus]MCM3042244.1 hypothetical protein [Paenibacillus lutimineralis]MCM3649348.1 hypothetical protein [Paenibacillus motobuensis]